MPACDGFAEGATVIRRVPWGQPPRYRHISNISAQSLAVLAPGDSESCQRRVAFDDATVGRPCIAGSGEYTWPRTNPEIEIAMSSTTSALRSRRCQWAKSACGVSTEPCPVHLRPRSNCAGDWSQAMSNKGRFRAGQARSRSHRCRFRRCRFGKPAGQSSFDERIGFAEGDL